MLWQLMRVDDPYIYKLWFQIFFALCPVFVYRISLRYTNRAMAIVATIYFIAFPTFFTDMPFLNRQEIAYLFVAACVMTASGPAIPRKAMHLRIGLFSVGVVLSHYSTSYVFFGTIAIGWFIYKILAKFSQSRLSGNSVLRSKSGRIITPSIGLINVALLLAGIFLWNGVATHTVRGLSSTVTQAIQSLRGGDDGSKSSNVSYSLFGGGAPPPTKVFANYVQSTLIQTGNETQRAAKGFYSQTTLDRYPLNIFPLANLPVSSLGHFIGATGLT